MKIIGFMGFAGSGKDTAANALLENNNEWEKLAFADAIKDTLSCIFGWERTMLEGSTTESREWRNKVDTWWSAKLGVPQFTPRFAMTAIGTDLVRRHFNDNLWILALERKIERCTKNIVITDCRYTNEARLIRKMNGSLIHISNGVHPEFYQYSSIREGDDGYAQSRIILETKYKHIHDSEWSWNNIPVDHMIMNIGSIDDLHAMVRAAS